MLPVRHRERFLMTKSDDMSYKEMVIFSLRMITVGTMMKMCTSTISAEAIYWEKH
ncbi:MAG: hypothetical protein PHC39_06475 [Proteiniphilum sp.]|nr:hypothetical protein [Proteiniphilum sp.]MDD3909086.1 hypothetical protein [Proteiniphilum sp.]